MNKADLMAGLKGRLAEFTTPSGAKVLLRTLRFGDRTKLMTWWGENKESPLAAMEFAKHLVALGLCDEDGSPVLTFDDVDDLDPAEVDAIGKEIGARSGLVTREDEAGKALPPATQS